jgi:hypothetical protein
MVSVTKHTFESSAYLVFTRGTDDREPHGRGGEGCGKVINTKQRNDRRQGVVEGRKNPRVKMKV